MTGRFLRLMDDAVAVRCEEEEEGGRFLFAARDLFTALLHDNGRAADRKNKGRSFYRDHVTRREAACAVLAPFSVTRRIHRSSRATHCVTLEGLEALARLFERKLVPGARRAVAEAAARIRAGDAAGVIT